MNTYQNLNNDPELLKRKTTDNEIKDLINKTGKHDLEKLLNSPKFDNDYYRKKYIKGK